MTTDDRICMVLDAHAKLREPAATLSDTRELAGVGMSSHASVNVMLALEDAFDIEFPADLLTKQTFGTIGAIRAAVASLQVRQTEIAS